MLGIALVALVCGALAMGSRAPLRVADAGAAVVRVSLGARPERIEECRAITDDELTKVLPQMRQRLVCDGTTARYRLEVWRDSTLLLATIVRGGGLRHDRQLYVYREMAVPPGIVELRVSMARIDTVAEVPEETRETSVGGYQVPLLGDRAGREVEERRRRRQEAVPAELRHSETVRLSPRQVVLVTYDQEQRRLVFVR